MCLVVFVLGAVQAVGSLVGWSGWVAVDDDSMRFRRILRLRTVSYADVERIGLPRARNRLTEGGLARQPDEIVFEVHLSSGLRCKISSPCSSISTNDLHRLLHERVSEAGRGH